MELAASLPHHRLCENLPLVMTDTVLLTVHSKRGVPTVAEAAAELGISADAIDALFGVVPVDPAAGLYCVRATKDRLPSELKASKPFAGPFSDPPIDTFGPQGVQGLRDEQAENGRKKGKS
jgi:hypothetical protein